MDHSYHAEDTSPLGGAPCLGIAIRGGCTLARCGGDPSGEGRTLDDDEEPRREAERLDELPIDSDVEVDDITPRRPPRPVHLRWRYIGLVAIGGTLGTAAREALSLLIPATGAFPVSIFLINITGAFALGFLLEYLLRAGPDEGRRRRLRLLVGTGFMGGYTTYSTLAVGVADALAGGEAALGILYGIVSVIVGIAAGFAGIALGAGTHRRRSMRSGPR